MLDPQANDVVGGSRRGIRALEGPQYHSLDDKLPLRSYRRTHGRERRVGPIAPGRLSPPTLRLGGMHRGMGLRRGEGAKARFQKRSAAVEKAAARQLLAITKRLEGRGGRPVTPHAVPLIAAPAPHAQGHLGCTAPWPTDTDVGGCGHGCRDTTRGII